MSSETWIEAFRRRLDDGTSHTIGWTDQELALPPGPPTIEIVTDRFGDRWYRPAGYKWFRNVDQDDTSYTREELAERYGPLTPFGATPEA